VNKNDDNDEGDDEDEGKFDDFLLYRLLIPVLFLQFFD